MMAVMDEGDLRTFERVLAFVCTATPLVIWLANGKVLLGSISAYYSIDQNQWFYFLLTAASILFLVNGVFHDEHRYNIALGVLLAGVVLFNHQDNPLIHQIATWGFFGGNFLVILLFSRGRIPKAALLAVLALAALFLGLGRISAFWAETASLLAISAHFVFDTIDQVDYEALKRGINPGLSESTSTRRAVPPSQ